MPRHLAPLVGLVSAVVLLAVGAGRSDSKAGMVAATQAAPKRCTSAETKALVSRFVQASRAGRPREMDALVAREPRFQWYAVNPPFGRIGRASGNRATLASYFIKRARRKERLELRSFEFNGNRGGYGNFEYTIRRGATDIRPRVVPGKGAALCFAKRADALIVWSMG